jgi:hypothetical protein
MIEQEDDLELFQTLETNARWWNTLSTFGVKIDPRAFNSADKNQVLFIVLVKIILRFVYTFLIFVARILHSIHGPRFAGTQWNGC